MQEKGENGEASYHARRLTRIITGGAVWRRRQRGARQTCLTNTGCRCSSQLQGNKLRRQCIRPHDWRHTSSAAACDNSEFMLKPPIWVLRTHDGAPLACFLL